MESVKRVAVTGAAGNIGYAVLPGIASGGIFGSDTPVRLQLLEIPPAMKALEGVCMEMDDCAFPLLTGLEATDDPRAAFEGADLVLLVGSRPRSKGMERNDLIRVNGPIFVEQGRAIQQAAASGVRAVVVGNPCNTNCLIAMRNAGDVPPDRWSAMTQLDHNRATAQLASKAGAAASDVRRPIIWGNHSNTQYPDWSFATVNGRAAPNVIGDRSWYENTFIGTVQERGKAIIEARGASSAMSAAAAAVQHSRYLFQGTPDGDWTSMAVLSDGSYDVPAGLVSSFPVTCPGDGSHVIVKDLGMDAFGKERLARSVQELAREREVVADLLG